jgi:hypothetical protein
MTNEKCGDRAGALTVDSARLRADARAENRDIAPLPVMAVELFAEAANPSDPVLLPSCRRPAVRTLEEDARRGRLRRHRHRRTVEMFAGATSEANVRGYDVRTYPFRAVKP